MESEAPQLQCDVQAGTRALGGPGDATATTSGLPSPGAHTSDAASISVCDDTNNGRPLAAFASPDPPPPPPPPAHPEAVLQWDGLSYEVDTKVGRTTSTRAVLNHISGEVHAGEVIAIIGSSGAGKTTLLNALSGRIVGGRLTGQILFHGAPRDPGSFKRLSAYVQQDDIMHTRLTVHETLSYASRLRLSDTQYTAAQKSQRVADILKKLRLEGVQHSQIGNAKTRGVSGGERKRVSIGTELLTSPKLLFLDEPTSGLDSNSSQVVVDLVKEVAREQQMAVLVTIHQPSARIFNTFDRAILLSQGHLIYFGPPTEAVGYFAGLGYQCPVLENPADYFIDLMTLDHHDGQTLAASQARISGMAHSFIQHRSKQVSAGLVKDRRLASVAGTVSEYSEPYRDMTPRNMWYIEFWTLVRRDWLNLTRNMEFLVSQVFQSLATSLIVGFMFFYLKHDSISVQNRLGILYIIVINATFPVIMPTLNVYLQERDIMLRERAAATYRVTAFYAAKGTTFTPIALVSGAVFIIGVYFISHLVFTAGKFFIAFGIYACLNVVAVTFALMVGSYIRNVDVGFVVAPAIVTIWLLFGGLLANPSTTTPVLRWLRWINPVYYAYSALLQNELHGMAFECDTLGQCYTTGEQVIGVYSMGRFSIWGNALLLLLNAAVYYALGYVFLRWKVKPRYIWI
ncbi:hypothetical protein LPJ61_002864 [Coemansia biformis]|uniref:ABC transporter domain-containing protein n=1 Tax=Coemansia biformis TaxID=1286918 RepID=A0A9W8CWT2_9FUNG|nr:hypothetical protein LPJ61_002864 [Coemansia biformis]